MKKKLCSLCLAVVMALSLAIPAAAADSYPTSELNKVTYLGTREMCQMPAEMATAYANALSSISGDYHAALADPNYDGMPILFTEQKGKPCFTIWTWDGAKAVAYNLKKDMVLTSNLFDIGATVGTKQGYGAIAVSERNGTDVGSASVYHTYKVSNGMVTHTQMHAMYSANIANGVAQARVMPLVNAKKVHLYDNVYMMQSTPKALRAAGWTVNVSGEYGGANICNVNGSYMGSDAYNKWLAKQPALKAINANKEGDNLCIERGSESSFNSSYSKVSAMRTALLNYANKAPRPAPSGTCPGSTTPSSPSSGRWRRRSPTAPLPPPSLPISPARSPRS